MILVGLTGPIGHGKTTFADALQDTEPSVSHLESSSVIMEVANAWQSTISRAPDPSDIDQLNEWLRLLPPILSDILGKEWAFHQIELKPAAMAERPESYKKLLEYATALRSGKLALRQPITTENKDSYRPLLQWLGGYLVERVDKGIWYNEIIRRAQIAEKSGVKLCVAGGVRYPSDAHLLHEAGGVIVKVYRPGYGQHDTNDPTERERDSIPIDCQIINNGTREDLHRLAVAFLQDLRSGKMRGEYAAVPGL